MTAEEKALVGRVARAGFEPYRGVHSGGSRFARLWEWIGEVGTGPPLPMNMWYFAG